MVGMAVFGADALSSIAYAPQETLVILAAAGTQAFGYAFPISLVITALLAIVSVSYLQTIQAYPSGGGAYTVVKENLGVKQPWWQVPRCLWTISCWLRSQSLRAWHRSFQPSLPFSLFELALHWLAGFDRHRQPARLKRIREYLCPAHLFFPSHDRIDSGVGFTRYFAGTLGML